MGTCFSWVARRRFQCASEMANGPQQDLAVGLFGRGKPDLDARELEVVHVELA